jgi:tRNA-Thr(GGU) m(6)t(6)A37 methyltransferase TsaA
MKPITLIKTPFHEKFGVPRQSLLVDEAKGTLVFPRDDFYQEAFRGLEESSHLWLIFEFHQVNESKLNGLVRPPRFEGKKKLGIYATRSPHRPNRIGLSVVKLDHVEYTEKHVKVHVSGVDLVDGTPIFDIKPYVPYCDAIQAKTPFEQKPEILRVEWLCARNDHAALIEKIIALDPRPGHDKDSVEEYGVSIAGYNVRFRYSVDHFEIISAIGLE